MRYRIGLWVVMSATITQAIDTATLTTIIKHEFTERMNPKNSPPRTMAVDEDLLAYVQREFHVSDTEEFRSCTLHEHDDIYAHSIDISRQQSILRIIRCHRIQEQL